MLPGKILDNTNCFCVKDNSSYFTPWEANSFSNKNSNHSKTRVCMVLMAKQTKCVSPWTSLRIWTSLHIISFIEVRLFYSENGKSSESHWPCMADQDLSDGRINIAWGVWNLHPNPTKPKKRPWESEQLNLYRNKIKLHLNKLGLLMKILLNFWCN